MIFMATWFQNSFSPPKNRAFGPNPSMKTLQFFKKKSPLPTHPWMLGMVNTEKMQNRGNDHSPGNQEYRYHVISGMSSPRLPEYT